MDMINVSRELVEEFVSCLEYSDPNNRLDEVSSLLSSVNSVWDGNGLPPVGTICEYFFQPSHILVR